MDVNKGKIKPILDGQLGSEVAANMKKNFDMLADAINTKQDTEKSIGEKKPEGATIPSEKLYVNGVGGFDGTKFDGTSTLQTVVSNILTENEDLKKRLIWAEMGNPPRWFRESLVAFYDVERQGSSNEEMLQLRKAGKAEQIKDFSPNHLDLDAKNFAWAGMSGFGGFGPRFDSKELIIFSNNATSEISANGLKIRVTEIKSANTFISNFARKLSSYNSFLISVTGIPETARLKYVYRKGEAVKAIYCKNGLNKLPESDSYEGESSKSNFAFSIESYIGPCEIVIEQIPLYPNALVFDGKDDYLVYTKHPKLEDYTIIADRQIIAFPSGGKIPTALATKREGYSTKGAFWFDREKSTASFGETTQVMNVKERVVYQTKTSYNGINLKVGSSEDTNILAIGIGTYPTTPDTTYLAFALWKIMLFDRTLTAEEIQWVKDHYFPITSDISMHERTQLDYAALEAQQNKK